MPSALITGITGQDGAFLAKLLLESGYRVIGIVRDGTNVYDFNLNALGIKSKVELEQLDLLHGCSFGGFVNEQEIDEVYHLAAQSSVGHSFVHPYETIKDNFNLTVNLIEQIRLSKRKVKFYNSVSSEIYGNQLNLPITESSLLNPVSPYALSKAFSYQIGQYYRKAYGLFICNGILFNHESELRRGNFFINKIINECINIKEGKQDKITVGNLNIKRDFGYAPDYVQAIHLMMQQDISDDYIVCSGISISLSDILNYVLTKLHLSNSVVVVDNAFVRKDEIYEIYGSNKKIKSIGWDYQRKFFDVIDEIILYKLNVR